VTTTLERGTCPVCGSTVRLYLDTSYYEGCIATHSYAGERCDGSQQAPVEATHPPEVTK
jgi:C4-type Zn-finger protein